MVAKQVRAAYTQEFRLEAVRLVQSGQSQMQVCQTLGIPKASLGSWVRQVKAGTLKLGVSKGLPSSNDPYLECANSLLPKGETFPISFLQMRFRIGYFRALKLHGAVIKRRAK